MSQSRIWLKYAKGVLIEKEKLSQVWGCGTELGEGEGHPAGQVLHGFCRRDSSRLLIAVDMCCKCVRKGEEDEVITSATTQCLGLE